MKKKVAIIGTNGIPAKYGGFETLVEYLAEYLSDTFDITVYCSSKPHEDKPRSYKGVNLNYINLNANGWQSIFFDFISLLSCFKRFDKILILGCSGSIFQPIFSLYRHKFIMNLGGLDWQRSKWNFLTRKYLKISERFAIKYSGQIIADNQGIKDYIMTEYGISSDVIAYGGDQVFKVIPSHNDLDKYLFLKKSYAFTVARIQPDNNIEMLCNSFDINSKFPLVIVGNWNKSIYGQKLKKALLDKSNLILLDAIYDQHQLNLLRSNCFVYLHGHSAGGTNPALVEAMNLELPIFAYDNNFNRYTTEGRAKYFIDSSSLKELLSNAYADDLKQNSIEMYSIAKFKYKWSIICSDYSKIFNK